MVSWESLKSFLLFARRWFVGWVAAYGFCSLAFGGTKSAKPVLHILLAAWTACLIIHHWLLRRRCHAPSPMARTFEVVSFNIALSLVLGELSIRLYSAVVGHSLLVSDVIDAHKLVPGRDYGNGLRGNRLGFAGHEFENEKRPGVFRVAALGDSFAVGPAVAFQDNFLTLLEADLPGVEIYNFGVSGSGPREYLAILRKDVWQFHPDLVLVCVFLGNDITETWPLPRSLDPRKHSLYRFLTRSWRLLQERWTRADGEPADGGNRITASVLSEGTYWGVEGRRLEVCLDPPSASMEKKWQQALGYLDQIVNDCRSRQTPVAFLLIPDEFQVDGRILEKAMQARGVDRDELDLDLPQRRLRQFCAERAVPCLDLKPAFERETETYAPRDTHWNEKGNRLAASCLGAWLRPILSSASWRR